MLCVKTIKQAQLETSPFRYTVIPQCFDTVTLNKLWEHLPGCNYYRSVRTTGSDKFYNVVNNILLKLGSNTANAESKLNLPWLLLVNTLKSKSYLEALSQVLQENLLDCPLEITLKRYGYGDFISSHTDKENVRATHMIFLNQVWEESWGGQLCFLYDKHTVFKKFLPIAQHSIAFVRANNSWHTVEPITKPNIERIAIQVAFWNITERIVLAGRKEEKVEV